MKLKRLQPTRGATLGELRALLEKRPWDAGVPSAFSDELLLRVALDFRNVEQATRDDAAPQEVPSLAAALCLVMHVLVGEPGRAGGQAVHFSQEQILNAMRTYQWCLEREIASRIIGMTERHVALRQGQDIWHSARI